MFDKGKSSKYSGATASIDMFWPSTVNQSNVQIVAKQLSGRRDSVQSNMTAGIKQGLVL